MVGECYHTSRKVTPRHPGTAVRGSKPSERTAGRGWEQVGYLPNGLSLNDNRDMTVIRDPAEVTLG